MIKVYSSPTCPWCTKAKNYLKSKGAQYTDVNVTENREEALEMMRISGQKGVPVLDINGEVIIGFEKEAIDSALNKQVD